MNNEFLRVYRHHLNTRLVQYQMVDLCPKVKGSGIQMASEYPTNLSVFLNGQLALPTVV